MTPTSGQKETAHTHSSVTVPINTNTLQLSQVWDQALPEVPSTQAPFTLDPKFSPSEAAVTSPTPFEVGTEPGLWGSPEQVFVVPASRPALARLPGGRGGGAGTNQAGVPAAPRQLQSGHAAGGVSCSHAWACRAAEVSLSGGSSRGPACARVCVS